MVRDKREAERPRGQKGRAIVSLSLGALMGGMQRRLSVRAAERSCRPRQAEEGEGRRAKSQCNGSAGRFSCDGALMLMLAVRYRAHSPKRAKAACNVPDGGTRPCSLVRNPPECAQAGSWGGEVWAGGQKVREGASHGGDGPVRKVDTGRQASGRRAGGGGHARAVRVRAANPRP